MTQSSELYIGLMSGTSLDAVDAALVRFANGDKEGSDAFDVIATLESPLEDDLRHELLTLINQPHSVDLDQYGQVHRKLGQLYGQTVRTLLLQAKVPAHKIAAIGCHGQTVRHQPDLTPGFTLQIGDAATVAALSNIPVVADFRSADIAYGGQGAPLAPAFHQWAFGGHNGCVVNIGGMANLTSIGTAKLAGFDTGPGNVLIDAWCEQHTNEKFDRDGAWAASGSINTELLEALLAEPYFQLAPPKSTGRELFNLEWLHEKLKQLPVMPAAQDVQATLCELTATTIATAFHASGSIGNIWLCGGGARNSYLLQRIAAHAPNASVSSTAAIGIAPDWVEAIAFAWLARARMQKSATGVPAVTGACSSAILGAVYMPAET